MTNKHQKIKILVLRRNKKEYQRLKIDFLLVKDSIYKIKRYNNSQNYLKLLIKMIKNKSKKVL
jgi:hypothetical protein